MHARLAYLTKPSTPGWWVGCHHCPHCTDEKTEDQTDVELQSEKVGKLEPHSGSVAPKPFSSYLAPSSLWPGWRPGQLYKSTLLSFLVLYGWGLLRPGWLCRDTPAFVSAQARRSNQGSGVRAVQPSRPGTNVQSRNRGPFVQSSVGAGVLPAATLCDQGGLSPPQRPAATPSRLAGEPAISLPPPSAIICLLLVSWEPLAAREAKVSH